MVPPSIALLLLSQNSPRIPIILKNAERKRKTQWSIFSNGFTTGLVCLWVSSWLLMYPHRMLVEVPLFDSVWGAFFKAFGVSAKHNAGIQQQPDLLCGIAALVVMTIMQLRGIFRVTLFDGVSSGENQNHRALKIVLNLLSITVHTLFFTMIIKVFLFPETGMSAFPSIERMKTDFFLTLFSVFCIAGMIFSVQSVAKLKPSSLTRHRGPFVT